MKNKLVLMLALVIAGVSGVQAQGGGGGGQRMTIEERVKGVMTRLTDSMGLKKEQLAGTETAFTNYYNAQNKLREGLEPGTRPDQAQMDKLTADRDAELQKVWTEAQFKQFKEVLEPNMRRRGPRPPGQ